MPELTHELSSDLRTLLRQLRLELGLSREALAARAGLSPRTIYAIEVEGVKPQRATRRVLAMALEVESSLRNSETPAGTAEASHKTGGDGASGFG